MGLSLLWLVVSYWPHWCDQYVCHQNSNVDSLTPMVPLHQTFHPWSNRDAPENVQRIEQSFLFIQPRGVSTVCLLGQWQTIYTLWHFFSLIPTLSLFLYGGGGALGPLSSHEYTKGSPLCRSNEKKSALVEDMWVSCLLVLHKVGRDSFSNSAFHFIWFLLPPVLHFLLPLAGISFSQDQVTWLQQTSISLPG